MHKEIGEAFVAAIVAKARERNLLLAAIVVRDDSNLDWATFRDVTQNPVYFDEAGWACQYLRGNLDAIVTPDGRMQQPLLAIRETVPAPPGADDYHGGILSAMLYLPYHGNYRGVGTIAIGGPDTDALYALLDMARAYFAVEMVPKLQLVLLTERLLNHVVEFARAAETLAHLSVFRGGEDNVACWTGGGAVPPGYSASAAARWVDYGRWVGQIVTPAMLPSLVEGDPFALPLCVPAADEAAPKNLVPVGLFLVTTGDEEAGRRLVEEASRFLPQLVTEYGLGAVGEAPS